MATQETFAAFLQWLGQNRAAGERKYEEVRQKLILLFRCRGCPFPEELADRTIDRTAQAVLKQGFVYEGDPVAYFRGVAHNVYLEWLREERRFPKEPFLEDHIDHRDAKSPGNDAERMSTCLEHCLKQLPHGKGNLLLRYYRNDKRAKIDERQSLAEEEGIGLNALRIQVFRLRNLVRSCVEPCMAKDEMKGSNRSSLK